MNSNPERWTDYQRFLQQQNLPDITLDALPGDASARRYFRLPGAAKSCLLMDMPPGLLDVRPYLRIAGHLRDLGLRTPEIYAADPDCGLALIEDLGDQTFNTLLQQGVSEIELYRLAIDQLIHLHRQPVATAIDAPHYDEAILLREAAQLADWFYTALTESHIAPEVREDYLDVWRSILDAMPEPPISLVLLDFHVDNLLRLPDGACGILDFQDARIGPAVYDVMSLLEDARRDVTPAVVSEIKTRYLASRPTAEHAAFEPWYAVLAAQRHCKVLGYFVRFCIQEGKRQYLAHIPRVVRLLERHVQTEPRLKSLRDWLDEHLPMRLQPVPEECLRKSD